MRAIPVLHSIPIVHSITSHPQSTKEKHDGTTKKDPKGFPVEWL
jgi:hypothetical protein